MKWSHRSQQKCIRRAQIWKCGSLIWTSVHEKVHINEKLGNRWKHAAGIHISMCMDPASLVVHFYWTFLRICHWTYFHISKGHVTWNIKKVNRIPTHCGVAYESVHSLARSHVIEVCVWTWKKYVLVEIWKRVYASVGQFVSVWLIVLYVTLNMEPQEHEHCTRRYLEITEASFISWCHLSDHWSYLFHWHHLSHFSVSFLFISLRQKKLCFRVKLVILKYGPLSKFKGGGYHNRLNCINSFTVADTVVDALTHVTECVCKVTIEP